MVKQHNNLHCIAVCQSQAKFGRFAASQWEYNLGTKPYSSKKKMDSSKFTFKHTPRHLGKFDRYKFIKVVGRFSFQTTIYNEVG